MPVFTADGQLVLAPGEKILWRGQATPVAEAAQGASGHEQWAPLWVAPEPADVTLTDRRIVWDLRKFVRTDQSWILIGGVTGAVLTAASAARSAQSRSGRTMAGQMPHAHLANLITGASSRTTYASEFAVTLTAIEPPARLLRVTFDVRDRPQGALELARAWTMAAAAERVSRLADAAPQSSVDPTDESAAKAAENWATLHAQAQAPAAHQHSWWGEMWALPLASPVG